MGQQEVHEVMLELRRKSNKWHTVKEIKDVMLEKGYSINYLRGVSDDLYRLSTFNFIKVRGVGMWTHHKEFQAYATVASGKRKCAKR